jgi:hypothetical protein
VVLHLPLVVLVVVLVEAQQQEHILLRVEVEEVLRHLVL